MSRVEIVELDRVEEFRAAADLFVEIWRGEPPITGDLLRALARAGSYVAGAYDGEHLVAASVAFFGPPQERSMHSHITGVLPVAMGRQVGFALKAHQRDWALARGVREIGWTFDPLIRRNAWFNLGKLGASAADYLVDFYGPMRDEINAGEPSDRLLIRWELESPRVVAAMTGTRGSPPPVAGDEVARVAVPEDIEGLRRTDPNAAHRWRLQLRDEMLGLLEQGYRITGFERDGWYVLTREGAA